MTSSHLLQRALGLLGVAAALACSFIVDTSEVDAGCGSGKKYCAGGCVDIDDPRYGCTPDQCTPCQRNELGVLFGDRVVPKCESGRCEVDTCTFGWGCSDCSERILTNPRHCGRCFRACEDGETCSLGTCVGSGGAGGEAGN